MQIEQIKISELTPYARNAKQHPDAQVAQIAASIKEFGFTSPVLINKQNQIIAGHGRWLAAQRLDINEVPCVRLENLTANQQKAYGIVDNQLTMNSPWNDDLLKLEIGDLDDSDFDIDLLGFDKDFVENLLFEPTEGNCDDDEVPQVDEKNVWVKPGDMFALGEHRLLCGDCTVKENVDRLMDGQKADMVFTSPPYAVGVDYRSYDDTMANLKEMMPKLSNIWMDIVVTGGYAVINFGDIVKGKSLVGADEPCEYPMALEYWPVFRADGWVLWSRRIWCKPGAGTGSMQCISSNRASTNWEHIWTWKNPGKPLHDKQTTGDYPSQNGWIDSTHGHKLGVGLKDHGAGMPVCVAEYGVSVHAIAGNVVFEPFCGTGTTTIACEKTGRRAHGMEIDPHYCQVIIERFEKFTGKTHEKI